MHPADPPRDGVSSPFCVDLSGWDRSAPRPAAPAPAYCPPLATSTEYGVSDDSTSPFLDRFSSRCLLLARLESEHAGCCSPQTILSSSLSIGNPCAAQTEFHSTLGGSATPVAQHSRPVFPRATTVRSFPKVRREFPQRGITHWTLLADCFGSHLLFCLRSVYFLLRSGYFTDSLLSNSNHGRCSEDPRRARSPGGLRLFKSNPNRLLRDSRRPSA